MSAKPEFSDWLQTKLDQQKMTQADLARESGLTTAAISRIMDGTRGVGPDASRAIAHALDLPEEEVFRRAGLLSPKTEEPPNLSEWIHVFWEADEVERDRMLEVAKTLLRESRKED